jgi:uncharacterized membrane protein YdbT with pleckstrin-like domain
MNEEQSIWKGRPSQWINIGPFSGALLLAIGICVGSLLIPGAFLGFLLLILPLAYMLWKFLVVHSQVFELTSQRLRITQGVINQKVDEIELYRVKDTQLLRVWWMRLTGLASISLDTSDRTLSNLTIPAIHGGTEMRELLRKEVEIQRDKKRVREMDLDGSHSDDLKMDPDLDISES